jgi:hypothetical protein
MSWSDAQASVADAVMGTFGTGTAVYTSVANSAHTGTVAISAFQATMNEADTDHENRRLYNATFHVKLSAITNTGASEVRSGDSFVRGGLTWTALSVQSDGTLLQVTAYRTETARTAASMSDIRRA